MTGTIELGAGSPVTFVFIRTKSLPGRAPAQRTQDHTKAPHWELKQWRQA